MTGDLKDAIRHFILERYLAGERPENLTDRTPLQTSGILDSLAVLAVVTFVEKDTGVQFTAHDTTPDQLDSIDDIARLVASKGRAVGA